MGNGKQIQCENGFGLCFGYFKRNKGVILPFIALINMEVFLWQEVKGTYHEIIYF